MDSTSYEDSKRNGRRADPHRHIAAAPPTASQNQPEGPLLRRALGLCEALREIEDLLELDDLDRIARHHARNPASGAADAVEALATLTGLLPDAFVGTDVNLDAQRLLHLADRERALALLEPVLRKIYGLVLDSRLEEGDELVELLNVGWARTRARAGLLPAMPGPARTEVTHGPLPAALPGVSGPPALAAPPGSLMARALLALACYQDRVISECAHRSEAERQAG